MPAIIWRGTLALVEQPTSPEYVFGESVQMTRSYSGPHATCLASAPFRGTNGTGVAAGFRVTESKVTRDRGGVGLLTIKYETVGQPSQGGQLPVDEFEINGEPTEVALAKHPFFTALTNDLRTKVKTLLETATGNPDHVTALTAVNADALAAKLHDKLKREFTHFPLYPPTYTQVLHYWSPPVISAGGFRQTPPTGLVTPPPTTANDGWIREGDRLGFNGTHWQLTRRWRYVPDLDADIFP